MLQNKVLRIQTGTRDRNVPTKVLLERAQQLSVHQLGAYHSVKLMFKVVTTNQPKYLAEIFTMRRPEENGNIFPHRNINTVQVYCKLSLSRAGFCFRSAKLWNLLPSDLRAENNPIKFKSGLLKWIKVNIPHKPP